jgi:hypothetical protein
MNYPFFRNGTYTMNLEFVFGQCPCFVETQKVHSSTNVDSLRTDAEYLLSEKASNSKSYTNSDRSRKGGRNHLSIESEQTNRTLTVVTRSRA